jgi:thiol-disulfide isomerase/thioredoxin
MEDQEFSDPDKLILADFSATWCSPYQTMIPVMEDLKKKRI